MLEMSIDSIRVSLMNYQRVVMLKEKDSGRYLPIWVGPAEADSIAVKLQDVSVPRPLTHDLLGSVIGVFGGTVSRVIVSDLQDDTFYAKLVLEINGKSMEVDCRPSDGIALAVRMSVPIYVEDVVLDKAGIFIDKETGEPIVESASQSKPPGVGEEELRGMSAFTEFIEGLNLEGLDQGPKGA